MLDVSQVPVNSILSLVLLKTKTKNDIQNIYYVDMLIRQLQILGKVGKFYSKDESKI